LQSRLEPCPAAGEVLARELDYWRRQLAGAPAALDLPTDFPRPPARTWSGVSQALALPPALCRRVRGFARRQGATTSMVLLAAWVALLRRISGQDDVVVGTVLAHRGRPELEGLIGLLAKTLPLRIERPGDPAFADLLATVRAAALGLYDHQDLPLEQLTDALRPGRSSAFDPLFQAFFALRGNAGRRELAPGLTLTWWQEEHGAPQFDLALDLEDGGEGIAGCLVGSGDLFTPATVERWARGWAALLADAVAHPQAPLSTLALLGAAERHALLVEWSGAPRPPAWSGSVPARIAAWAAATPEAIAVEPATPGQDALTYGDLMARAHRLAGQLRARGVGPDVRVGIYAERSPETLVGMLAVLAAGGAFLPLDPAHPPERLAAVLEDAQVAVLLARHDLAAALPAGGATLVPLDGAEVRVGLASLPDSALGDADVDPGDLAYVIYTSGSTGRPKGVLVPHRGFLWAVEALAERSGLGPESRVLQFAAASFDASVWETWSALISGAAIVFARGEDLLPGPPLLATLRRRRITNVFLTPTALAAMPEGAERGLPDLGGLVVGGEAFPPDLVARWASRRLWNAYGPTEASICSTMARLGEDGQTPIGRPIADHRHRVLGRHLELLPRGVPGELYLGGAGLARGYLGKPDLTARAFLPDPFSGEAGARLYRTGDLVRFRSDGQLEFLGRADRQVKVRGFRIEPGEVEAQLAEHPGVREAAVVPYEATPRDLRLAAYVVAAGPAALSAHEARAFLRTRLPEHMVPSAFHFLAALPLSPSGKIDRRALPPPGAEGLEPATGAGAGHGAAAPRTPVAALLAGIWGEVLGRAEVGAGDDFFDLGGHSLLVGQVLTRVRAACGVELPVRAAFEARTLAALTRRVEEALRALPAGLPPRPPLVRVSRAEPLPLSFAQQRLWFLDRLEPGSPVYNLLVAWRLAGPLDPGVLGRSLDEVWRRHEALRTTFAEAADGEPRQVVAPYHPAGLPRVDLTALRHAAARSEALRQATRAARRPFDLARGPVARALLLRLGEQEHHLLLLCHHIAFDGWSVGVFRRELGALYGAFAAGRPSPLSEPAFQYGDFAVWQRRWLSGEALAAQLAYWRERLAGAPAALELPADRQRPPVQSFRGATRALAVPAALAARLRGLARGEGSTLFMTALAAFSALLGRFGGQEDLVVGSPVANRTEAAVEELLGFFVNTLALRADLSGDPSCRTLLARVRESALSAYAHQDLPFERLVEELQPERDLSRSPLFQVMCSLAPAPGGELVPGLACEPLRVDTATAMFDLALFLEEEEQGGLTACLEYATDLFDAATVTRLGNSYLRLLSGLVEQGARSRVADLPLLGAGERWQILGEWSEPCSWAAVAPAAVDPVAPVDVCLHDLVAAQVERTPSAVALVAGGERLTYRDLGLRARRLARQLAALGVGPEVRVAVCLSRSPALLATLLGILEAGGAYVPLDPSYPPERLGFMLEDAGASVLVTETALASRLPASRAQVLVVDNEPDGEGHAAAEAEPPRPIRLGRALPGNLAYLIYTSGSTGRPKAVAIEHRSAVAFVHWALQAFSAGELAAVLASTSICFDLSVFELFVPLARGGRVVLAADALALAGHPAAAEVTLINTVPSAMAELLRLDAIPAAVRTINLAGEALRGALVDALHRRTPARVLNLYGPSEDTTYSTFEVVPRGRSDGREPAIGRPLAGSRALLLDAGLRPVPPGVPGELYLGGAGLARGYLGRPELTSERFVPDPWAADGERLYRTGDLARWLPDGRLDYLGRSDHQVKLRGYRIELGEIELALESHSAVAAAVVLAPEVAPGERRLIAYLERRPQEAECPVAALREHLRRQLPDYMLPAAVVWLARLPRNANGKADRRALAASEAAAADAAQGGFAAPRGAVEELIAGLWAELLRRERVSRDDNFFDLGGHSLLASQVMSRLRAATGVELPLRRLFEAPTVERLAAGVAEAIGQGAAVPVPPIVQLSDAERAAGPPLSFAQRRLWFLHRLEPASAVYNLPCAYRAGARLDAAVLRRALREVVRRHEALRTTFDVAAGCDAAGTEDEPRQLIGAEARCELPLVDLARLPAPAAAGEAERLALAAARRPFDLAAGPLLRGLLLRCAVDEDRLVLNFHHIAADGWSLRVLAHELGALYPAFAAGRPSPLPELALQYADYAAWQRRTAGGAGAAAGDGAAGGESCRFAPQVEYWRRRLAAPVPLTLPADRPPPPVATLRGAQIGRPWPAAKVAAARDLGRREGATLFMTLLAGLAALLHRYSGQDDVCVGTPVLGRPRPELEPLIGVFVNTLVLRHDLAGAPSGSDLLARVRETALGAFAHQDVPFEQLVEELQPERSLARTPLFQVAFVVQEEAPLTLAPGLVLAPLPLDTRTSKFSLTLALLDRGGEQELALEFSTDLFERATAQRLLGHYERLLEELCAHPERQVTELPLLTAAERQQLVTEWNDTRRPRPRVWAPLVHQRFAEHARRRPQALAVVAAGQRLTYGELEARANRLAHALRALGVGPEVRVAICAEQSAARVVGVLAVLKAGGAYVSIDPAYPRARIAYLLADAQAAVLLAEERLLARLPETRPRLLPLDGAADAAGLPGGPMPAAEGAEAAEAPAVEVHPDNLAYIIYTSGSTGMPKGVGVPHRGLVNYVLWFQDVYGLAAGDRGALMASPTFDPSELELWPALAAGASVAVADEEARLSAPHTLRWWADQGITLAFLATPLAEVLLDEEIPGDLQLRLRILSLGGDRLHRAPRPGLPFQVWNLYGPSESTITATREPVPPAAAGRAAGAPPIGRPIDGTHVYVLDRHRQPVPAGVPGELHVAGVGLARGYLGRPGLTAERFLPDPWGELRGAPGARMYSTGDLVRWLPDGRIDFLGRIDGQVKLRGMRVEPGEIEAVLARHPGVREAAVAVAEGGKAGPRLVGFVVLAGREAGGGEGAPAWGRAASAGLPAARAGLPALEELKDYLRAELPVHMVPAALVALPALPLTVQGKVDRQALAAAAPPRGTAAQGGARYAAPRTPLEEKLAALMVEVLGVPRVGIHDSFFDLGGHSLLGVRLLSRLQARVGVELPLRRLFEQPTVAGLASSIQAVLDAGGRETEPRSQAPLTPVGTAELGSGVVLSSAQRRLWFADQLAPGDPTLNVPFPLLLSGPLDRAALAAVLREVERRHGTLRTVFREVAGELLQRVRPAGRTALPLVDLGALPAARREAEAEALTSVAARLPFDLAAGPVWRAALVRLEERRHRLLLGFHHIVADGWSMGVLEHELATLYEAFSGGRPSPLAALPVQVADVAVWQHRAAGGDSSATALAYWRRQLAGLPLLRLPTDRPRPARRSSRGAARFRLLPAALVDGLRRLARQEEASLFMVMLAAFTAQLGRYCHQQDVVVGSPVAQRERPETEGLIGCFVNNLVLRADLRGDPPFRELVRRLRDTTLAAHAHAHLPFERLVEELEPRRDRSRSPLFQVMLAIQPAPERSRRAGELEIEPLPVHTGTAQYELVLYLAEKGSDLDAAFVFSTDLFDAGTVERMLADLHALTAAVVEEPGLPLSRLPVGAFPAASAAMARAEAQAARAAGLAERDPPRPHHEPPLPEREAHVAARRARLSPEQRALLDRRLRRQAGAAAVGPQFSARVAIQPQGTRPPFFCVHPAGGDVLCYGPLARHLGADQPFYGFQSPGLGAGAAAFDSLEAMAAHYVTEMRRTAPPPYRLGGWSLGGVVAFEMARQLASQTAAGAGDAEGIAGADRSAGADRGGSSDGAALADCARGAGGSDGSDGSDGSGGSGGSHDSNVALLAILDSPPGLAPDQTLLTAETYGDDAWWLAAISDYVAGLWGKDLGFSYQALRDLDGEERLRRFLTRLQDVGLPGSEAGLEQLRRLLATFKGNIRALQLYTPSPYSGRVTLFRVAAGSVAGEGAGHGDEAPPPDPTFGWPAFTRLPVAVEDVPGDHMSCLAEPHVRVLAARLRAHLDNAAGQGNGA
jgi:amino acid adenylation domain-containing protein